MFTSQDPLSLVALLVGRDNAIFMYIMVAVMLFNKREEIKRAWTEFWTPKYNTVAFHGVLSRRVGGGAPYGNFEDDMRAIVHYICKNVGAEQLNSMETGEVLAGLNDDSTISTPPLPVNTAKGIKLTADIEVLLYTKTQHATRDKQMLNRESETHEHEEKQLTLVLRTKGATSLLTKFVADCQKAYNKYLDTKSFKLRIVKPVVGGRRIDGISVELETTKTFDNLFFEGKEALIQRLDAFNHKDKYIKMGLPHTLGLLFHGQPGTGKTSCIKAIANYMQMSLILVPMNKIKTRQQLEDIFLEKYVAGEKIPQHKRIYVLEEVDCNGWAEVIKPRKIGEPTVKDAAVPATQAQAIIIRDGARRHDDDDDEDDEKLTLGALLEMLDGIIETPGRIVIMTTNNPEALDPALRRPGRIDMELEFKRLRRHHIAAIYERWYGRAMKEATMQRLVDYKWSQADIGRLLFKHENNAGGFVDELLRD